MEKHEPHRKDADSQNNHRISRLERPQKTHLPLQNTSSNGPNTGRDPPKRHQTVQTRQHGRNDRRIRPIMVPLHAQQNHDKSSSNLTKAFTNPFTNTRLISITISFILYSSASPSSLASLLLSSPSPSRSSSPLIPIPSIYIFTST